MMDFNFLAAANGIQNTYLNQSSTVNAAAELGGLDEEAKKKFGDAFAEAYDSMVSTKALSNSMRESYNKMHQDDFKVHANRLGYSIDNRVIDMLGLQLSDDMNKKINEAMNNAINSL